MFGGPRRRQVLWFERLLGFEESLETVKENLTCEKDETDELYYITGTNNKRYCAGRFEHVSVAELNKRCTQTVDDEEGGCITTLGVVKGDVVSFINNPENNGAVFQVASQFNCLEFINPAITPEAGVDRYEYDHTQGPACSIACGAATVYRNYYVDMPITERPGQTEPQEGQTEDRQLDGFEDIAEILGNHDNQQFTQKNGYLTANEKQLDVFLERLEELKKEECWDTEEKVYENMWSKLKLGVHHDVEVTSKDWGAVLSDSPGLRITQVFASAAAVGYSRSINRSKWEILARGILDASYDGLFAVAAQNKTKKLFITFIGGGVFQNSMSWISDAIYRAAVKHRKAGITAYLVCYGAVPEGIGCMVAKFNKLKH
ncbi:hypothetical protein ACHWQZ_G005875 [Mnemiopsis leidyi]